MLDEELVRASCQAGDGQQYAQRCSVLRNEDCSELYLNKRLAGDRAGSPRAMWT